MELQQPKVAMYVKRSFGEKLTASFDFMKENWKLLLKFTTYLLLPVCLVQALSLNGLMGGMMAMSDMANGGMSSEMGVIASFFSYYGLYALVYMIGTVMLTSLVYALMRTYNEREERLEGITLGILKPMLFHNMKRMFIMIAFSVLLIIAFGIALGIFSVIFPYFLILLVPALIAVAVPFALWAPIYLFEDITIMGALKKTFRLGFATWGGIFLVSLIMGLIGGILQGITMMPWYIMMLVKVFFAASGTESEVTVSIGYNFILYLLTVVQAFGAYLSMIITLVGLAYQYGHASEKEDNVTVESDIDNFDKL
ncbi:MAG: hypothetical protein LUE99_13730 [Bacteroides sp.]|nr:hypothetical protein [Bacteroides sp.]